MVYSVLAVPDRSIRAQQASSTRQYKCEESKMCVRMYICSCYAVIRVVLTVMSISVIYKFLSLGL